MHQKNAKVDYITISQLLTTVFWQSLSKFVNIDFIKLLKNIFGKTSFIKNKSFLVFKWIW